MKRNKLFAVILAGALTLGAIPLTQFNATTSMEGEDHNPSECVTRSYTRIEQTNYIPTNTDREEIEKALKSGYVSVPHDPNKPIKALSKEDVEEPGAPTSQIIDILPYHGDQYFKFLEIRNKSHNTSYKMIKGSRDTNDVVYCLNMDKKNPESGTTMRPVGKVKDNLLYIIRLGHPRGHKEGSPVEKHFYKSSAGADWRFWNYYITQIAVWIEMGYLNQSDVSTSKVIGNAPGSLGAFAGRFHLDALKYGPSTVVPEIHANKARIKAVKDKDATQLSTPVGKTAGFYLSAKNCATDELNDQGAGVKSFIMRVHNAPKGLRVLVKDKKTGSNRVYEVDKGQTVHIFAFDEYRFVFPNPGKAGEFRYTILGDCTVWRAYEYTASDKLQNMLKENLVSYGKEISTQGSVYWEVPTQPKEYTIRAKKVDADTGNPLPGAEFTLKYPNGTTKIRVSNVNGIATWTKIPENQLGNGKFIVTETKAPPGYTLPSQASQTVILPPESGTEVTVRFKDKKKTPDSFSLKAIKKDAKTKDELYGAEFTLTKPDNTTEKGVSNTNGEVVFDNLTKPGKYIIEETKAPDGYRMAENPRQEVNVTDIKNPPVTEFIYYNEPIEKFYSITATKVDKGDKKPLQGAVFELTGANGFRREAVSGADGVVKFTQLKEGTYTLTEVEPPEGYQLAANPSQTVTVPGNTAGLIFENEKTPEKLYEILATKVDKADKKPLQGATFELTGENGFKKEAVSGTDGIVKFKDLKAGTYTLTETKAPEGYKLATNPSQTVTVPGNTTGLIFENEKIPEKLYEILATKVDKADKKPLQGATFELTGENGFKQEMVTGEDGTVKFKDLKAGTYTLTETKAPYGYQLAANPSQTVTVPGNTEGLIFENEKIPDKGRVELLKHDSVTNKHLEGVEFELYKRGSAKPDENGNSSSDTLIGKFTTNSDGKIVVENLDPGDYYFVETKGLDGYIVDKEKLEFTIPNEGGLIQLTKGNKPDTTSVEITKVDVSTGKPLAGAHIRIYAEDKTTVLAEGDTDSSGKYAFGPLTPGKYFYQETGAPEGYVLDDTLFPFEVKPGGEIVKCTMTNKPIEGSVEITKTDVSTGEVLAGAHIKIYAEDKETILAGGVTDENGKFAFGPLKPGKYFYQESGAPEGYVLDNTLYPFEIKNSGEIVKCKMTNRPIEGTLEITKVDISDGKLLPNAHFIIYDENKNQVVKGVTDNNGIATFQLGYGKYYYQEYDAPVGYQLDNTLFPFEIKTDGEIVKCRMTNVPKPVPVPQLPTTGSGIAAGGSIIAVVGAVASALFKRWM